MGLVLLVGAAVAQQSKAFPPGWNGLAQTPPMGWRSWNAYHAGISQELMLQMAVALAARNRTVAGHPGKVSLCDLGYCSIGVDEGWEDCTAGAAPSRQHDAAGLPTIDARFPDMGGMVARIHDLGLTAGWYLNGCACGEHVELMKNYQGDVDSLHKFGFDVGTSPVDISKLEARLHISPQPCANRPDRPARWIAQGVKIDGCGLQKNMTYYAELMQATGKSYTIENCHWGHCTASDNSSCPTTGWCPFNWCVPGRGARGWV